MSSAISFRAITDDDLDFLSQLYASTREEELRSAPWTLEEKNRFLRQQFDAQHQFYQQQFAEAQFDLILQKGIPIGRLYVSRTSEEIRIIDIALLPGHRRRGLGTMLMQSLLEEAKVTQRPVRIHVESFNPALGLYQRLGFRKVDDQGVYQFMEWTASRP